MVQAVDGSDRFQACQNTNPTPRNLLSIRHFIQQIHYLHINQEDTNNNINNNINDDNNHKSAYEKKWKTLPDDKGKINEMNFQRMIEGN